MKSSSCRSCLIALCCLLLSALSVAAAESNAAPAVSGGRSVLVVVGLPGEEEYATAFNDWAGNWRKAATVAGTKWLSIGFPATHAPEQESKPGAAAEPDSDKARLQKLLEAEAKSSAEELWIVLIGHGTFNGKEAKFNLRGPDISSAELTEWLKPFQRPLAILDCASASAPFLNALSATNRVVVSATRSGYEQNLARFGKYLSESIAGTAADLDKDGQVSLLEAFILASKQTAEFYKSEGRLATEHALLDDNGDAQGTPADWFRGVRAVKKAGQAAAVDGARAHQWHLLRSADEQKLPPEARARRDELELSILSLRERKSELPGEEYYTRLEALLIELAKVYGLSAGTPSAEAGK